METNTTEIGSIPVEDRRIKVLLVEDDEDDYIISRDLLGAIKAPRYEIDWAPGYEEAVAAIEEGSPDVCLVDYHLGEHNGLELLRHVHARGCSLPLIMLTGQGDRAVDVEAMEAGASDYLSKGKIDSALLERSIRYAIERKRAEVALARQAKELARSNAELADFAYIASHDLKEPLRGIQNYVAFFMEDYADQLSEDSRDRLNTVLRLTKRLEELINTLLHYSRVGRLDLAVADTDLQQVLDSVLDSLHVTIQQDDVEIRVPELLPTVRCDQARVAEIFRNLITNALKYNDKPKKWIEISFCRPSPNGYGRVGQPGEGAHVFCVRDNGIGIPEKHLDSIFRIFRRLHGRDKYGGGTGAGLTVVKKVVERHEGEIWVQSTVEEGTRFYFTLEKGG